MNEHLVFDGINLEIQKGEKIALIGPSGHGKSTILKLISGLLSSKDCSIEGEISVERHHQNNIGMLFQQNALFDSMTVSQNISFFLQEKASELDSLDIASRVDTLLSSVELTHAKDLYPSELSGGMKKRVGIARALALKPQLLIFDDPTAGLDPILTSAIGSLLKSNVGPQNTALLATSDMKVAFQFSNRIFCILNKKIIDFSTDKIPQNVQDFLLGN